MPEPQTKVKFSKLTISAMPGLHSNHTSSTHTAAPHNPGILSLSRGYTVPTPRGWWRYPPGAMIGPVHSSWAVFWGDQCVLCSSRVAVDILGLSYWRFQPEIIKIDVVHGGGGT